jgi:hypothetical protein
VDACGGIALDSSNNPVVTWEAEVGAKSWAVFAARWEEGQQKWIGLGEGALAGGRAVSTYLDIDGQDRLYLATSYTIGSGLNRVTTTQVWRWDGVNWRQLGPDMPKAGEPVIGVYENVPYLVLRDDSTGALRVTRWRKGSWQELPSPGSGAGGRLDFSPSGKPIVAYLESLNEDQTLNILVKYWTGQGWRRVGGIVAEISCHLPTCYPSASLDLSLDSQGRPIVAWSEHNYESPDGSYTDVNRLNVKRYKASLP